MGDGERGPSEGRKEEGIQNACEKSKHVYDLFSASGFLHTTQTGRRQATEKREIGQEWGGNNGVSGVKTGGKGKPGAGGELMATSRRCLLAVYAFGGCSGHPFSSGQSCLGCAGLMILLLPSVPRGELGVPPKAVLIKWFRTSSGYKKWLFGMRSFCFAFSTSI